MAPPKPRRDFPKNTRHHATIILSDIHFGKKSCRADMLLEFLTHNTCDTLILNGDIIDGWVINRKKHRKLPELQKRAFDLINARAAAGTKVIYIPGNHDEKLRKLDLSGKTKWNILFADSYHHTDRRNRRFFIVHGDQFDAAFLREKATVLYHIGDKMYDGGVEISVHLSKAAHKVLGYHFSIAAYAKRRIKSLGQLIGKFTDTVLHSARTHNVDGVICGHIHHAEWSKYGGVTYGNSGDWVESCTALCEDMDGNWRDLHWFEERANYGLKPEDSVTEEAPNLHADLRPITTRQLRVIQHIWHPKNYKAIVKDRRKIKHQVKKHAHHATNADKHRAALKAHRREYAL